MRSALVCAALLASLALPAAHAVAQAGTTARSHVERPPEGSLRRGVWPVPEWVAYAGGAAIFGVALAVLIARLRTKR